MTGGARGLLRGGGGSLEVRLDEPEPHIDAARDLGEQVGGVGVVEGVGLVDGGARRWLRESAPAGQPASLGLS
jgi:hypothetical protein